MRHPLILSIAIAGALAVGCSRPARPAADLVITRANVWTGNLLQPAANAIAIVGGRIVDVGDADQIEPLGTDWTVAPLNPMLTLYAAATRATLDGKNPNGWVPEQKISVAEAVTAYTSGSAFAEFQDAVKGTIARGKLADVVILSDDVFSIPAARLKDVQALTTIAGGKIVHQRRP